MLKRSIYYSSVIGLFCLAFFLWEFFTDIWFLVALLFFPIAACVMVGTAPASISKRTKASRSFFGISAVAGSLLLVAPFGLTMILCAADPFGGCGDIIIVLIPLAGLGLVALTVGIIGTIVTTAVIDWESPSLIKWISVGEVVAMVILIAVTAVALCLRIMEAQYVPKLLMPTPASVPSGFTLHSKSTYNDPIGYTITYVNTQTNASIYFNYTTAASYEDQIGNFITLYGAPASSTKYVAQNFTFDNAPGVLYYFPYQTGYVNYDLNWNYNGFDLEIKAGSTPSNPLTPQQIINMLETFKSS